MPQVGIGQGSIAKNGVRFTCRMSWIWAAGARAGAGEAAQQRPVHLIRGDEAAWKEGGCAYPIET